MEGSLMCGGIEGTQRVMRLKICNGEVEGIESQFSIKICRINCMYYCC